MFGIFWAARRREREKAASTVKPSPALVVGQVRDGTPDAGVFETAHGTVPDAPDNLSNVEQLRGPDKGDPRPEVELSAPRNAQETK